MVRARDTWSRAPALNVWEDEKADFAEADLPGVDAAKLEVTVTEGNQFTIQGERPAPEIAGAVWVRQERPSANSSARRAAVARRRGPGRGQVRERRPAADAAQARGRQAAQDRREGRVIAIISISHTNPRRRYSMSQLTHNEDRPRRRIRTRCRTGAVAIHPRVDVWRRERIPVFADMPGVKPEDVDVRFEKGELAIHGRRARPAASTRRPPTTGPSPWLTPSRPTRSPPSSRRASHHSHCRRSRRSSRSGSP